MPLDILRFSKHNFKFKISLQISQKLESSCFLHIPSKPLVTFYALPHHFTGSHETHSISKALACHRTKFLLFLLVQTMPS